MYKSSKVFLIINNIIIHNLELEYNHHHHSQYGAGMASSSLFTVWNMANIIIIVHSMTLKHETSTSVTIKAIATTSTTSSSTT
jgi:hypothetical protein